MAVTRFLVDKQRVEEDGELVYKLYFYDSMDNVVICVKAPVYGATKLPVIVEKLEEAPIKIEAAEQPEELNEQL